MPEKIQDRLELLRQLAARLAARREDLVIAAAADMGAPCKVTRMEVDLAEAHLQTMEVELPHVEGKSPYGLVAAIFPYDAPAIMLARVGGAAILGGNRFRFSCSSQTPRVAAVLKDAVASFPDLEAVVGMDNRAFGQECVRDPEVRVLFISGGGAVGETYAGEARAFDKLFFAGPSGLPPVIFFKDADLERAAHFTVRRAFLNGGQYCTTLKRAYVHRDIYDAARALLVAKTELVKVGDPLDLATTIGPIRIARTRQLLERALEALPDPRFLVPYRREGEWQGPFLLETPEPPDVELFGPFLALTPVAGDHEAVQQVCRSRYPFLVSFFGAPPPGGLAALKETFGMVYDNPDFVFTPLRLPFGGKGDSGWIIEWRDGKMLKRDGAFIYSAELVRPAPGAGKACSYQNLSGSIKGIISPSP